MTRDVVQKCCTDGSKSCLEDHNSGAAYASTAECLIASVAGTADEPDGFAARLLYRVDTPHSPIGVVIVTSTGKERIVVAFRVRLRN